QAEDGIRDRTVTGVQTCALPISETARRIKGQGAPAAGRPHPNLHSAPKSAGPTPPGLRQDVLWRTAAGFARGRFCRLERAGPDRSEERRVGKERGSRGVRGRG